VDNWSDAEVFQNHCEANPVGARGIVTGWRAYCESIGETPPGFLEA
jgi:hypothetical protein